MKILSAFFVGTILLFSLISCEKKGPAERAGEAVDEKIEQAGEKLEDARAKLESNTDN